MGNKGSQTQQTQNQYQTQTYTPNAAAAGYITNALDRASATANNPFAIPQAPVAGFSQDQLGAFQQFRDLQGSAQPYYNDAARNFTTQGIQDFYNPYAANVMAGLKDIFGAQQAQTTGQLTQAAGGVGADRIAVGQAELARQQGLSAGQTLANLWQSAGQQAQAAGQAQMALGANVQNSRLQGSNALLGTGGLQQQLTQAQMNSPYQQQLAMAAFPYQQAQFLAGITGSLAPGLGGTTQGWSNSNATTTPPSPSIWSQLLGAGALGLGAYNAWNDSGSGSTPTGNFAWTPQPGGGSMPMATAAEGGVVKENPYPVSMAEGGIPNHDPIDVSQMSFIPQVQLQPIQPHVPQIQFSQPQQPSQQSQQSNPFGDVMKLLPMLAALKDGGAVKSPYYADAGVVSEDLGDIYRMPDQVGGVNPYDTWRRDTPVLGRDEIAETPLPRARPRQLAAADDGGTAMAYTDPGATPPGVAAIDSAAPRVMTLAAASPYSSPKSDPAGVSPGVRQAVEEAGGEGALPLGGQGMSPYSRSPAAAPGAAPRAKSFMDSPWAALMSAGLGIMSGTSPYAGVNIGQGGMQGLKMLQTQRENAQKDESLGMQARRLEQEAQHHIDSQDIQRQQLKISQKNADKERYQPVGYVESDGKLQPVVMETTTGRMLNAATGQVIKEGDNFKPAKAADTGSKVDQAQVQSIVKGIKSGQQPPTTTGLYGYGPAVRAQLADEGVDIAKMQREFEGAKQLTRSINAPRMVAYVGLNRSVDATIDRVRELADQMKLGGIPFMNKLELTKYIQTQGNTEKGKLATQYVVAVNTLKEEFANLANGGYAPTEAAWKLANEQVNGNYGQKQLGAAIDEIQRLIRYRLQAVPGLDTMGPNAPNRYVPGGGNAPPAPAHGAPAAAPPAAGAAAPPPAAPTVTPDVVRRFNELTRIEGKSEEEAYRILHEEGSKQGAGQ